MGCLIHKWNGCTCARCGAVRDGYHNWLGYKCSYCGKKRDVGEIEDQAVLADIALNIKEDESIRVEAIKKLTDQSALLSILKNDGVKNIWGPDKCKETALKLISDEKMLLDFAESYDDYSLCYEAYRYLNVIPRDYSPCYFSDVISSINGSNKDAIIDYIINEKLGYTVGLVEIRKSDIEILYRNNQTEILGKIAKSRMWNYSSAKWDLVNFVHERAISSCVKAGGHHFNQDHACKVCGVVECEITGNHFWNDCICTACGLEEHNWQFSERKLFKGSHVVLEGSIDIYRCAKCGKEKEKDYPAYQD